MFSNIKDKTEGTFAANDIHQSVVKATNRKLVTPKTKHVQGSSLFPFDTIAWLILGMLAIIHATIDRYVSIADLCRYIHERSREHHWVVGRPWQMDDWSIMGGVEWGWIAWMYGVNQLWCT